MYCLGRAAHTRQGAEEVAMAKNAAGGKWKAIHCKECSLWHVEAIDDSKTEKV